MTDHSLDRDTCPVTGKPRTDKYRFSWTDHAKAGLFNSCPMCVPDGLDSVSGQLAELEQRRTVYRDTSGMDRFYGGQEPPFEVNDEFARTGRIKDY